MLSCCGAVFKLHVSGQELEYLRDKGGGICSGKDVEGLLVLDSALIGTIADGADDQVGDLVLVAELGDGGTFHFNGVGTESLPQFGGLLGGGDEDVSSDDRAGDDSGDARAVEGFDGLETDLACGLAGQGEQGLVGGEENRVFPAGQAVLDALVVEAVGPKNAHVVMSGFFGDDDVTWMEVGISGAGDAGEQDAGRFEMFDQEGGGHGSIYLSDACPGEDDGLAGKFAGDEPDMLDGVLRAVGEAVFKQGDFLVKGTQDGGGR